uniref:Uncharacterized protein n=1 Tax=Romanomermis culicivorax TaxID=13658 RepID=A0A915J820_ROMCU
MAKHMLGHTQSSVDCQVATAATDRDLTDHEPTALDKSFPCHTDQQKLDFALNKMTEKTYVTTAQTTKALCMLGQNRDVFSLPGDKPNITSELTHPQNCCRSGEVKAIAEYKFPMTKKGMQSFLGLVQWCKQFIPKLATLSSPLYGLLPKDAQYVATEEHHAVFEGIKKAFTS